MDKQHVGHMTRMGWLGPLHNPTSLIFFSVFLLSLYLLADAQLPPIPCTSRDNRSGLCYIPVVQSNRTYQGALDYCYTYVTGGYLARVHDSQTLNIILESSIFTHYRNKYWIGIGDPTGAGVLSWWNGTEYTAGDYPPDDPPRWSAANTAALTGQCVVYNNNLQREGSVWGIQDCDTPGNFICEFVGASCATLLAYSTPGLKDKDVEVSPYRDTDPVTELIVSYDCKEGYVRVTDGGQRQFWWQCRSTPNPNLYHPSNEYLPRCSAMTCDVTVPYGTVTLSGTSTVINQGTTGNLVLVTCEEGFYVDDDTEQEVVCITTTEWAASPTCMAYDCDLTDNPPSLPPRLTLGPVTNPKSGYVIEPALTCDTGFSVSWPPGESSHMVCDVNNDWINIPTCEPNLCGNIGVTNGQIVLTDPTVSTLQTLVEFSVSCDDGYGLAGTNVADDELICDYTGAWGQTIFCNPNDCSEDESIPNAVQVTFLDNSRKTGQPVEVTCYEGYYLTPNPYPNLLCDVTEVWVNKPACEAYQCTGPLIISHGAVTPDVTAETGTNVQVACDVGYKPFDVPNPSYYELRCGPNGVWTNPAVCLPNPCTNPTFPFAAVVNFPEQMSQSGETPTVTCLAGYRLDSVIIPAANCAPNGTWTNPPSCLANPCGSLSGLAQSGVVSPDTALFSGDTVTVTCNLGYYFSSGPNTLVYCHPNQTWINPVVCLGYPCNSTTIPNVASLSFDPTPPRSGSDPAVLCQKGYRLSPTVLSPAMCLSDGTWSNKPQCVPNNCSEAYLTTNNVANAVSVYFPTFPYVLSGMVPTITCQAGYSVNTTSTVCLANGVWDNKPACSRGDCPGFQVANALSAPNMGTFGVWGEVVCDPHYSPSEGNGTVLCTEHKTWAPTVQCIPNVCLDTERVVPNTATLSFENDVLQTGNTVTMTCDVGYLLLSAPDVIQCQRDGVWANKPVCQRKSCVPLAIVNGYVEGSGRLFGDTATVVCYDAYYMEEGTGTAQCEESGQWAPTHVCTVNRCNPLTLDNGVVSKPDDITSDVALTLTCDVGFVEDGFANPFVVKCARDGVWFNRPSCVSATSGSPCQAHGVAHAQTTPSQPIRNVQTTFVCDAGYQRDGPATVTCSTSDGSWSGLPTCNPNTCEVLTIQNSDVPVTGATTGNTLTVQCRTGYGSSVDQTFTPSCNQTGAWEQTPLCLANVCTGIVVPNGNLGTGSAQTGTQPTPSCNGGYIPLPVPIVCLGTGQLEINPECLSCSECLSKYNANYPTLLKEFSGTLPDPNTLDVICGRSSQYGGCLLAAQCSSVRPADDAWRKEGALLDYVCTNRAGLVSYKSCIEQTLAAPTGRACQNSNNVMTVVTQGQPAKCSGRTVGNFYGCLTSALSASTSSCDVTIRALAADWFNAYTTNTDLVPIALCGGSSVVPVMLLLVLCAAMGIVGQHPH